MVEKSGLQTQEDDIKGWRGGWKRTEEDNTKANENSKNMEDEKQEERKEEGGKRMLKDVKEDR